MSIQQALDRKRDEIRASALEELAKLEAIRKAWTEKTFVPSPGQEIEGAKVFLECQLSEPATRYYNEKENRSDVEFQVLVTMPDFTYRGVEYVGTTWRHRGEGQTYQDGRGVRVTYPTKCQELQRQTAQALAKRANESWGETDCAKAYEIALRCEVLRVIDSHGNRLHTSPSYREAVKSD